MGKIITSTGHNIKWDHFEILATWRSDIHCRIKDARAKIFLHWFFSENFTIESWWVGDVRNVKKWGVTDFFLERTCPEEHLNLSNSGFVSEEVHSGCKSQNTAIRALKGIVLCQIWFKWTYCWFSHDVTKFQTSELLILQTFYFYDIWEQLKTNTHTNFHSEWVLVLTHRQTFERPSLGYVYW